MKKWAGIFAVAALGQVFSAEPPPYPGIESWEFRRELYSSNRLNIGIMQGYRFGRFIGK